MARIYQPLEIKTPEGGYSGKWRLVGQSDEDDNVFHVCCYHEHDSPEDAFACHEARKAAGFLLGPTYQPDEQMKAQIERAFSYHPPKDGQTERYTRSRSEAKSLALFIARESPRCREQSLALTKLEEALMWFNAAIARNE